MQYVTDSWAHQDSKFYLPSAFLQFMKRTKEQQELDIENEERQEMFKNQISDAMKAHG